MQPAQSLAVSPDDSVAVVADKTGALSWALLSQTMPMMLAWQPIAIKPSSTTVKLSIGDVNGDKLPDLVAVWTGAGQPAWGVLLGSQSGGFTPDSNVSAKLTAGAGTMTVDALSVGDVEQDGLADVVVGSGWTLRVLSSQSDDFLATWSTTLTPTPPGTKLTSIATGKLDTTIDSTKLLDIVVGSDGLPDPMGTSIGTLFLQAFRGN